MKYFLMMVLTIVVMMSGCTKDKKCPTCPTGDEIKQIGSTQGTAGDTEVKMDCDIYKQPATGSAVALTTFSQPSGALIGNARLIAKKDVVDILVNENFTIPGETIVTYGTHFNLKVEVAESGGTYQIKLTNLKTLDFVSFTLNSQASLAKKLDEHKQAAVDMDLFTTTVATQSALLCVGTGIVVSEVANCKNTAIEACGSRGVESGELVISFSIADGCSYTCLFECKAHNQGGTK